MNHIYVIMFFRSVYCISYSTLYALSRICDMNPSKTFGKYTIRLAYVNCAWILDALHFFSSSSFPLFGLIIAFLYNYVDDPFHVCYHDFAPTELENIDFLLKNFVSTLDI